MPTYSNANPYYHAYNVILTEWRWLDAVIETCLASSDETERRGEKIQRTDEDVEQTEQRRDADDIQSDETQLGASLQLCRNAHSHHRVDLGRVSPMFHWLLK